MKRGSEISIDKMVSLLLVVAVLIFLILFLFYIGDIKDLILKGLANFK